ncbi:RND family efflux transporter MFP subunit [Halanaerobium congolense]|jgi:multidrug efflux pump subunit AcrA (membrane-fusion protein)|uniref:RND family efflux transporter MFP subunit n=1 Tax=Halanaerobium congolense TaxID=54121 RepID=A0A4R8GCP5_9FIRM|nr:efflux RND transporter periplasmic adaptor subunit [Halanaerobium congolense]KXS49923.1 MAG: RND family efflux transporter, MFP subunit [Halanaerobium sp. T82-1]TDX41788.1 RND family efflux transporter MFP subunit [Halanaerobium congolense]
MNKKTIIVLTLLLSLVSFNFSSTFFITAEPAAVYAQSGGGGGGGRGQGVEADSDAASVAVETVESFRGDFTDEITVTAKAEAKKEVKITSDIRDFITSVNYQLGDEVEKNDLLIELDTSDSELDILEAEAALKSAEADLEEALNGPLKAEIAQQEARVKEAESELKLQQENYQRQKELYADEYISKQELEQAANKLTAAESSYISAEKSLELLKAGARKEQIKKLESQKLRAELNLKRAVKNQNDRKIKTPISGIVSYLNAQAGEKITADTTAIITDISQIELTAYISELYINDLEKGETIKAYFNSIDQEFEGEIIGISPRTAEARNTFPVKMQIDNPEKVIKAGMNAAVSLITARANDVVIISQDALLEENGENYIYIIKDSTAKRRSVKVFLENEDHAVISSGLEEGEKAAAVGKENLRDGIKVTTAAGGEQ